MHLKIQFKLLPLHLVFMIETRWIYDVFLPYWHIMTYTIDPATSRACAEIWLATCFDRFLRLLCLLLFWRDGVKERQTVFIIFASLDEVSSSFRRFNQKTGWLDLTQRILWRATFDTFSHQKKTKGEGMLGYWWQPLYAAKPIYMVCIRPNRSKSMFNGCVEPNTSHFVLIITFIFR